MALVPRLFNTPPITMVGSRPPLLRTFAIMAVVEVFPWAPDTAIAYLIRISSASISALGIIGIFNSSAAATSAFPLDIAVDVTITSAFPICSFLCPLYICAPSFTSLSVIGPSFKSEPDTLYPRLKRSSAMPLMPIPPMPTKCI